MSLRTRIVVLFGSLLAALVLAQQWWVRTLTDEVSTELGELAVSVGSSVAEVFVHRTSLEPGTEEDGDAGAGGIASASRHPHQVLVVAGDDEEVIVRRLPPPGSDEEVVIEAEVLAPEDVGKLRHKLRHYATPGDRYKVKLEHRVQLIDGSDLHEEHLERLREEEHGSDAESTVSTESTESAEGTKHDGWTRKRQTWVDDDGALHDLHYLSLEGPDLQHRIPIPEDGVRDALARLSQRLLLGTAGFLGIGLLLAGALAYRVTAPLRRLADAARDVGSGALGAQVDAKADGEVGEALAAFNAMSERLAELDAQNRQLAARQHLSELGEVARGLAHTLRNPLNTLGLSVEELAARVDDAGHPTSQAPMTGEAMPLADAARHQIRRIDDAIRSFLVLASQGVGAVSEVSIGELAQDVALEALQDARGKVRLEVEIDEGIDILPAVEPELRAVLQALVVNAVEASPEGATVTLRTEVLSTAEDTPQIRVEVEDGGPGLAPEVRQRLFTPHQTTKPHGSGMGLFLAHRIATTRYDGHLELLDRDPGQGGGTRAVLDLSPRSEIDEPGHKGMTR